ncbi:MULTISPECIES: PadR family transcriptional regulator [unclassified Streptomyces]|uniref:PadR family transcriptional regulator n=1 Tax=unclassified Streptomyces TaxID=2593676 RepID=UPI002DDBD81A|nr:PadR family transcriptional regulator [Streptomyces sp. NBC_01750]WSB03867.1 PadR family transcriptional regulator [Streptomyces sp. NBC_01794]WSD31845.1 PadR family transcriptional regulator [Streptomyces sp. NBC_01750]
MAAKRRRLSNPLALVVMVLLAEKTMHPYEIAQTIRQRGKENSVKVNFGSLYTVVQNLEKHGLVEVTDVQRQGNRPERTLYGITEAGRAEMAEWLSDLLAVPAREYPLFETALSLMGILPPEEVMSLLADRLAALKVRIASARGALQMLHGTLPRIFVVENEYQLHMIEAEAEWLRGFLDEVEQGTYEGVEGWRTFHETGELPPEFREPQERAEGRPTQT